MTGMRTDLLVVGGGLGGVAQRSQLDDLVRVYPLGGHRGGGGFQDAADLQDFQHRVFAAVQVQYEGQGAEQVVGSQGRDVGAVALADVEHSDE